MLDGRRLEGGTVSRSEVLGRSRRVDEANAARAAQ